MTATLLLFSCMEQEQQQRTFLRSRFLRLIRSLRGRFVEADLFENTKVTGHFLSADIDFFELHFKDLNTPCGTMPNALLRSTDAIVLRVDLDKKAVLDDI